MSIHIISPGALTTVQDIMGAVGHLADGFPAAGAMDRKSAALANVLVGNKDDAAVIEMTVKGAVTVFLDRTVFALTGADMNARLNGVAVPMNAAVQAYAGDRLELGFAVAGCRTYLGLRGGVDVPAVMGSRSTNLKSKLGGYFGRKLESGDVVAVFPAAPLDDSEVCRRHIPYTAPKGGEIAVRAIPGPQDYRFTDGSLNAFFSEAYAVTPESDRMGLKLSGTPLESRDGVDIISDGIVFGSVQVPKNGMPIVLMADRQTTGGYAKIATVIEADLHLLAQAKPGDRVRFVRSTPEEAASALKEYRRWLKNLQF